MFVCVYVCVCVCARVYVLVDGYLRADVCVGGLGKSTILVFDTALCSSLSAFSLPLCLCPCVSFTVFLLRDLRRVLVRLCVFLVSSSLSTSLSSVVCLCVCLYVQRAAACLPVCLSLCRDKNCQKIVDLINGERNYLRFLEITFC